MTVLRRLLAPLSTGLLLSFASAQNAMAQQRIFGPTPNITGTTTASDIRSTILSILQAVLSLLALIAVVVIVVAGIRLIVGGSDDGQREKARNMIVYAVIGLVVILLAQAIVNFVNDEFIFFV